MNKAILSIILSAIFIVFSNNQVEAQCCSNPLDEYTITTVLDDIGPDCEVKITFCHTISPLGVRYIKICSFTISTTTNCDWSDVDFSGYIFWEMLYDKVIIFSDNISSFPPCSTINQSAHNVEMKKAKCWTYVNDTENDVIRLERCDGEVADCIIDYVICRDSSGEITKTILDSRVVGESNCYYEGEVNIDFDNPLPPFCFDTCF